MNEKGGFTNKLLVSEPLLAEADILKNLQTRDFQVLQTHNKNNYQKIDKLNRIN